MMKRRIFLWMGLIVLFFLVGFYQEGFSQEIYKVKHGDTLQKVSKKFGVSQKEIKEINKLRRSSIRPHQTLLIPSKESGDAREEASYSKVKFYVVKKRDNLYTISKKTGISIDGIKDINRLRNNRLRVGQILALAKKDETPSSQGVGRISSINSIPAGEMVPAENSFSATNNELQSNVPINGQIKKTEVIPSDNKITMDNAALIQKNSTKDLAVLGSGNDEATNSIPENDTKKPLKNQNQEKKSITKNGNKTFSSLKAPSLRSYVVKRGDNIYKISRKFRLSVASIKKINHLPSNTLKIGQMLALSSSPIENNAITENTASVAIPAPNEEEEADSSDFLAEEYNKTDIAGEIQTTSDIIGKWNGSNERNLLVKVVMGFLGTPYKWGGSSIKGLDCSAFVRKMYSFFDIELPRTAREQSHVGKRIARSDLEIGDLVFFNTRRPIGHVGIYVGNNEFVHASYRGKQVKIDTLDAPYYDKRFIKAVRLKGLDEKK
jgi:cell wall-associated NlpC family hydrolase